MLSVTGKFCQYSNENLLFMESFLKPEFIEESKVFGDFSLLLRKPALSIVKDLIELIELQQEAMTKSDGQTNGLLLSHIVPKFIAFGQPGSGVSVTLAQVSYYAGANNWLIFPFDNAEEWLEVGHDHTQSCDIHHNQHCNDFEGHSFDFPSRSANWLRKFLTINKSILDKVSLVVFESSFYLKLLLIMVAQVTCVNVLCTIRFVF